MTGPDGVARIPTHAPAYLVHDTGSVGVAAEIRHAGHGSVRAHGTMRLAVPLSLSTEVVRAGVDDEYAPRGDREEAWHAAGTHESG